MPLRPFAPGLLAPLRRLIRAVMASDAERVAWAEQLVREERAHRQMSRTEHGRALARLERMVLVTMTVATVVTCSGLGLYAGKIKPEADLAAAERARALSEARERLQEARKRVEEARRQAAEDERPSAPAPR